MLLEVLKAIIFGAIEGITEWLPISSTGHLVLFDNLVQLNVSENFQEMFEIIVQLGAIMAVIILYFTKLNPWSKHKTPAAKKATWQLWAKVLVGSIPAAAIGFIFEDAVHEHLFKPIPIAISLIVYGIVFIVIEGVRNRKEKRGTAKDYKIKDVYKMDYLTAFKIGVFQCLAVVPGTSRSGSTIIGGLLCGCSRVAVSEFSFFLAIPVMFGWSLLKVVKFTIKTGLNFTTTEIAVGIVGTVVAFLVSIVAIRFLIRFIQRHSFSGFGWYRIVLGIAVLVACFGFGLGA